MNVSKPEVCCSSMTCSFPPGFLVVLLNAILSFAATVFASEPGQAVPLAIGEISKHALTADQTLSFEFDIEANTPYLLEIDQGGLDLVLTVKPPGGQTESYNSPLLRDENEWLLLNAEQAGPMSLSLSTNEHTGVVAQTVVQLTEIRSSNEAELEHLAAWRLMTEAAKANYTGTSEGWTSALQAYEQSNVHWARVGEDLNIARNLYSMATIEYSQMFKWDRAARLARYAAELYRASGKPHLAANAIALQAAATIERATGVKKSAAGGLAPEARVLFNEALVLFGQAEDAQQQLGRQYDAAKILNNTGVTYFYMGKWDPASRYWHLAAELFQQLNEWEAELDPLANLAVIDLEHGHLVLAIEYFQRTLDLLPAQKMLRYEADTLDNLATAQLSLGQLDNALRSFSGALAIHTRLDDKKGRGRSLAGIGTTYFSIGEIELALEYLENALSVRRDANDGRGQVAVLNSIGNIKRQSGEFSQALAAHRLAQSIATAPIEKARGQLFIAIDLIASNRPDEALEVLVQVETAATELGSKKLLTDTALSFGDAWLKSGKPQLSIGAYQDAANGYLKLGLKIEQAQALFGTARAARELDQMELALARSEAAISAVESLRRQLIAPELRAFFLASRQEYFTFLIDLLFELHRQSPIESDDYLRAALSVSERSRARALIDLINEAATSTLNTGAPRRYGRQEVLTQQMAESRYRLNKLHQQTDISATHMAAAIATTKQELAEIENELNLLLIESYRQVPSLATLSEPKILNSDQIQDLLDEDSALLQYALGEDASFVWLITRNSIRGVELSGIQAIEQESRTLYERLKMPSVSAQDKVDLAVSLERLSNLVIEPIGSISQRRLIVVADGVLQYLPFSVLYSPGQEGAKTSLLASHEIVYLPSMSVLAAQRQIKNKLEKPDKEIAIFADPVFSSNDDRLQSADGAKQSINVGTGLTRKGTNLVPNLLVGSGSVQLKRLPATLYEAQNIASLVSPDRRLLAVGFDANREAVIGSKLSSYRIIHFATHGLIDSRYPALSALAFSSIDELGRQRDGFLRLYDIYHLDLNADLVTLSACSTALGRDISGEGLIGLTQGLMYSGSRAVLASLWQVPDQATAELMKRFYQNLLQKNQSPAKALRNAQLELAKEPRWRSPYFWSAFVLQGEWL